MAFGPHQIPFNLSKSLNSCIFTKVSVARLSYPVTIFKVNWISFKISNSAVWVPQDAWWLRNIYLHLTWIFFCLILRIQPLHQLSCLLCNPLHSLILYFKHLPGVFIANEISCYYLAKQWIINNIVQTSSMNNR